MSANPTEHLSHLKQVFQLLQAKRLQIQPSKCILARRSVEFLGQIVDANGIRIPDSRVNSITTFDKPTDRKSLERFLGIYAFVHRFIPRASKLAAPLHELRKLRKDEDFRRAWTSEADEASIAVKQAVAKFHITCTSFAFGGN